MLARFQSQCPVCLGVIRKGDDIEITNGKAHHPACAPNDSDRSGNPEELAERLGFVKSDAAATVDWPMRCMSPRTDGAATGRTGTSTR